MHRRTPASTLNPAVTPLTPSRSDQRKSSQRNHFRLAVARRISRCSTVTSVSVEKDDQSAVQRPWTTFENHIKAIDVSEVQLEAKRIARRPASVDFQKVLHEFQANEDPAENTSDLDPSLIEESDAVANDVTTGARTAVQHMTRRTSRVRGSRESDIEVKGNPNVKGQEPRPLDQLTNGGSGSVKLEQTVAEESRLSDSVWNITQCMIMGTRWNADWGSSEDAWRPVQNGRTWKEQAVDERMRRELYERYIERPNSWSEGLVTDSGRRIVEELVSGGGMGSGVNGRRRGRRSNVEAVGKEDARRWKKKE